MWPNELFSWKPLIRKIPFLTIIIFCLSTEKQKDEGQLFNKFIEYL